MTKLVTGFSITPEELYSQVTKYITSNAVAGWANLSSVITGVKKTPELQWANPLELKNAVEKAFAETFGAKEAAKPKGKVRVGPHYFRVSTRSLIYQEPKKATAKTETANSPAAGSVPVAPEKSVFESGFLGALHKPGGNPQTRPDLRDAHLATTHGEVWTRFPPEPNGYLHIGHSKAIFVNFGYAAHHGGKTYLRYDDTNPEKEEGQYFESILEMVRWLGYEPWKVTYSSDYFDQLYELAVELIKRDKAYVCHCTSKYTHHSVSVLGNLMESGPTEEEIKINRGEKGVAPPKACTHRTRPVTESLQEFENMKNGVYKPQEANLRMKQDLTDGNPQMWDLTAYRVLNASHHRTHDRWKIYPTYDFTHCLVDSFENIS